MALTEFGLKPDYINKRMTEELLILMFIKRKERSERELAASKGQRAVKPVFTSNEDFFRKHGIRVTNHG